MTQTLALVGIAAVVIGFILILASVFTAKDTKVETKAAFVGFIGPFPFGFGSDKQTLYFAIGLTAALFVFYFIFFVLHKPF